MKHETLISPEQGVEKLREIADVLFRDSRLMEVCREACLDQAIHAKVLRDPMVYLRARQMHIPAEFAIEFFEQPPIELPPPDWVPFILEFTNCRTVWVRECDDSTPPICSLKNETLCLGFRLYPNPLGPGPIKVDF